MKKALLLILFPLMAVAGALKVWAPGDAFNVTDLNANFSHLHSTMVGGHGARLVDADVSPLAGIAHSKLATPGLVPKSLALVGATPATVCSVSPCSVSNLSGATYSTVTRPGTGQYSFSFTYARVNGTYQPIVTPTFGAAFCALDGAPGTSGFFVTCYTSAGVAANAALMVTIMDDNT